MKKKDLQLSAQTTTQKKRIKPSQGFFQALCRNTVFVFQIELVQGLRPFFT